MSDIDAFIRAEAQRRGIAPDVAVKVAMSEGGVSDPARRGTFATGSSWWPFQLHYGGRGTPYEYLGDTAGMGNTFTAVTGWGPGDPRAWRDSVRYALDHAKRYGWGAWYGAAAVGITGYDGIDRSVSWGGTPDAEWDYLRSGSGAGQLRVTDDGVRVRTGPGTEYPILTQLGAGTLVEPVTPHGWRHVRVGNMTGWAAATYLDAPDAP